MTMRQITNNILMIRPANFGFNEETAANNAFQTNDTSRTIAAIQQAAVDEFNAFVAKLQAAGITVIVIDDTTTPVKTDAVFPNNWITFHENGTVITYPMFSRVRRRERREDIITQLGAVFNLVERHHLETFEAENRFLEGTGSMILDRPNKMVYACLSPRTDQDLVKHFAQLAGYEACTFDAVDPDGKAIYHTNVMMALGETFVVICMESIPNPEERQRLIDLFKKTEKDIIEITYDQMLQFAGNMLQVAGAAGTSHLVMSTTAFTSLRPDQIKAIEAHTNILTADIPTIEIYGGGSVRCMMAEIFLPTRNQ
jgi:hypothetical protein